MYTSQKAYKKRSYPGDDYFINYKRAKYPKFAKATTVANEISRKVKYAVKRQINSDAEKKLWVQYAANQTVTTASASSPYTLALSPAMSQGNTDGTRIGNKIKAISGRLSLYVNLLSYNATTNPQALPTMVRLMLVRYNKVNTASVAATDAATALFETTSGVTGPQGNMLDMVLPINRESYTVYDDRCIKLGATGINSALGPSTGISYQDASEMNCRFDFDLKPLGVYEFNDSTTTSTNKNVFLFIQAVAADGGNSAAYQMVETHWSFKWLYTDM